MRTYLQSTMNCFSAPCTEAGVAMRREVAEFFCGVGWISELAGYVRCLFLSAIFVSIQGEDEKHRFFWCANTLHVK